METVVSALISAGVTLAICVITQVISASRTRALIEYRLEQLEHKVDKHNQLIDRMYKAERDIAVLKEER